MIIELEYEYEGTKFLSVTNLYKLKRFESEISAKLLKHLLTVIYRSPLPRGALRVSEIHTPNVVMKNLKESHFKKFLPQNEVLSHSEVLSSLVRNPETNCVMCEIPVWTGNFVLMGHIDLIEKIDNILWIWDYKGEDVKNLPSYTQVWLYRKLLSERLNIPEERIRMGYFDKNCEVEVEETTSIR